MSETTQMEEALALALRLPPGERLRLVERVVASVGQEFADESRSDQTPAREHWGKHVVQLVKELDLTNWTGIDANDPVEWVRRAREDQAARRGLDWESDE